MVIIIMKMRLKAASIFYQFKIVMIISNAWHETFWKLLNSIGMECLILQYNAIY